jgi:RimJ/RimL family protein N-acetyltransferase
VTPETWHRVASWWSDLFGAPLTTLWRAPVTLGMHAGLGDYPGVFVVERHGHVQVSLPDWVTDADVRELERELPAVLASREFWATWSPTTDMTVLGPAVHAFTDREPDVVASTEDVEQVTADDLSTLRDAVTDEDWEESGFDHADGLVHAVLHDDRVVAAAHLSAFLGGAGDVNVLVAPTARGHGLGAVVGSAATRSVVRTQGLARWRARVDNAPSRALSAALGFEDFCRQLAVRPAEDWAPRG